MVDRFIAGGQAPAFARMAAEGASAEALISTTPTLTAPAHATLWTGAEPRLHGIAANSVSLLPTSRHTVLEWQSGFASHAFRAEPIWITAARAGRRVLVPQASQGYPFSSAYPDRLLQFDVYESRLLEDGIIEGRIGGAGKAGGAGWAGRAGTAGGAGGASADGGQGVPGFTVKIGESIFTLRHATDDSLRIVGDTEEVVVRAGLSGAFSAPMTVRVKGREAQTRFRLLSYDPKSGAFRLFHGAVMQINASDPSRLADFRKAVGAIVGERITAEYAAGEFGSTIATTGTGEAEGWLKELILANHQYFEGVAEFAARESWDLLVLYVSSFDTAAHALTAMLDPDSSRYSAALAAKAWPRLADFFVRTVDTFLAKLRARFTDATFIVVSDHGQEGVGRRVLPNVALRLAGLLTLDSRGRVDLSRTKAVMATGKGHVIFVNSTNWRDGIVRPEDRGAVVRAASAALLNIKDPETGTAPIRAVFNLRVDGEALGAGGDGAGDLIFDPAPDYFPDPRVDIRSVVTRTRPAGLGVHGMFPTRRKLQAIFYAAGPGVAAGRHLGLVRSVDIAPTVAALLGIPPPAHATGRALPIQ
ncbi:MAG: alkaline phosphatase family protein [Acidobacteria bacterium]|nr:alkaline phosphatase family protein [Acidobacteriota bacterium]